MKGQNSSSLIQTLQRRAAVVLLSRCSSNPGFFSRCLILLVATASLFGAQLSIAQQELASQSRYAQDFEADNAYLAAIELHTAEQLYSVLKRADKLFSNGDFQAGRSPPVAFILHGAEAKALQQSKYQQNKALVDLAARLSAFQVVDIKVCETWMKGQKIDATMLPPFIGTVPNGPKEQKRLMEEQGYVYF
ncbi:MAG: hypothetical protein ACR2P1_29860 [Pseudomonadales bacterium]